MNKLNKKGFTLIELLATVVLLGIIAAIAMVSIDKILDHSDMTECDTVLLNIKSATKEYISDMRFELSSKNKEMVVNDLITLGYLTSDLTDPFGNKKLTSSQLEKLKVNITLNDDYTYQQSNITKEVTFNGKKVNAILTCDIDISSVKEVVEKDGKKYYYVRFPG